MTFIVTINGQNFDVHDRFKNIIASVATGELLSLYDEHTPGQRIRVERFTTIINDKLEVQEYLFEGTEEWAEDRDISERPKDVNDQTRIWRLGSGYHVVSDELAFYYAHLPPKSIVKLNNVDYYLSERHTNIVTWQAPLGSGLFSQLDFSRA